MEGFEEKEERLQSEEHARFILAPIYGEVELPSGEETAELEATRDLLLDYASGYIEETATGAGDSGLLSLICETGAAAARITAHNGEVGLRRRPGGMTLPAEKNLPLSAGCVLRSGKGASVEFGTAAEGLVKLGEGAEAVVVSADAQLVGLRVGRLYLQNPEFSSSKVMLPGAELTAGEARVNIEIGRKESVQILLLDGSASLRFVEGPMKGREISLKPGQEIMLRGGRIRTRYLTLSQIKEEISWVGTAVPRKMMLEMVGALCMAVFFTWIAVVRIASAATPLPTMTMPAERAAPGLVVRINNAPADELPLQWDEESERATFDANAGAL